MRFTFLNKKRDSAPSFKARYDAFMFASLAIAQILSIAFSIIFLWYFLQSFNPIMLAIGVILFLAFAFYFAYSSAPGSHIVSLISLFGIEALSLEYLPQWAEYNLSSIRLIFTIDDYLLVLALFDFFVITLIIYLNTSFSSEQQEHEQN